MSEYEKVCPHCGQQNDETQRIFKAHAGISVSLGVASLFGFPLFFGLLAIVIGIAACLSFDPVLHKGRDFAVAGITLGIVGLVGWMLSVIGFAFTILVGCCAWAVFSELLNTGTLYRIIAVLKRFGSGLSAVKTNAEPSDTANEDVPVDVDAQICERCEVTKNSSDSEN